MGGGGVMVGPCVVVHYLVSSFGEESELVALLKLPFNVI